MRKYSSCLTIAGAGLILFGILILIAVLIGYDPTGMSNSRAVNLFVLRAILARFLWAWRRPNLCQS